MANTTNFNWETPDDTDLVKDGAAAIRTLGNSIDTSLVDLKGGTTGQILSKASNTDLDYTWITNDVGDITAVTAGTGISGGGTSGAVTITNDMATTITASGDLVVGTGSGTYDNLPIGTTGQVLTADTTVSPYKVKWAAAGGATFAGCSLIKTVSTQTINNATWTAITWDGENYDTDGYHSTSTNTSRITIPAGKAGKYLIVAGAMITANNTGARLMKFEKNGAGVYYGNWMPATPTHTSVIVGSQVLDLAVNDYIEVFIYQDSGGSLSINGNNSDSTLTATYLGA